MSNSSLISPNPPSRHSAIPRILAVAVVVIVLVGVGILPRIARGREAVSSAEASVTHPRVTIAKPTQEAETSDLMLPGSAQPFYMAKLYARVDGYLRSRSVDIGTRVKSGEVVAVISSPEIDQQLLKAQAALKQSEASLLQSKASLKQAQANAELARLTKERDQPLGQQHAISQQIVDTANQTYEARVADVGAAEANIAVAEANINAARAEAARLQQMQRFERIVAPFNGVITQRNVEKGDLISVGSEASKPLFAIAQTDVLKVEVDVPQAEAVNIHDGDSVVVTAKERVGRQYLGKVVRNATALDDAARTLRTEVEVPNTDGSLISGMYTEVRFALHKARRSLTIPANALVVDAKGTHVLTVDANHVIHFVPIVVGKDSGTSVQVLDGLNGNEAVVLAPNDLLREGEHVTTY